MCCGPFPDESDQAGGSFCLSLKWTMDVLFLASVTFRCCKFPRLTEPLNSYISCPRPLSTKPFLQGVLTFCLHQSSCESSLANLPDVNHNLGHQVGASAYIASLPVGLDYCQVVMQQAGWMRVFPQLLDLFLFEAAFVPFLSASINLLLTSFGL